MVLRRFLSDDSAAVTVDWVVLSAAVVGLGLGAAAAVQTGVISLGNGVGTTLSDASVAALGFGGPAPAGVLDGVGTPGCDWFCHFAAFHEAENGPYDPDEWGPDVNHWANERVAEFERYPTEFLRGMVEQDYLAWVTPQNTPEPYYSYHQAEAQIIRNIIARRGG